MLLLILLVWLKELEYNIFMLSILNLVCIVVFCVFFLVILKCDVCFLLIFKCLMLVVLNIFL